jgi:hypothetical protein
MPLYLGEEASTKRRTRIVGGISAVLALLILILFWQDVGRSFRFFFHLLGLIFLNFPLESLVEPAQVNALLLVTFNCLVGFLLIFLLWLFLISAQAILPVNGIGQAYRAGFHLLLYMFRRHGPAVFVRDGKIISTREDRRNGPGVVVVDYNSAIVLESRTPLPGIRYTIYNLIHTTLMMLGLASVHASPRPAGPGIAFTSSIEFIRGAVDLRKQFRMQPGITAYTRDGIEISARVFTIFTIGQPADILQVTYDGDPRPENLRVVTLEPIPDGQLRVTGLSDELERNDRDEIHHFIPVAQHNAAFNPYTNLPDTNTAPTYDPVRVFAAVFSQARVNDETILPWSELPVRVAASFYREMLSQTNFDQLYNIRGNTPVPLLQYKARLRRAMRNHGILSYRLLFHSSGEPLVLRHVYPRSELLVSQIRPLVYPKVLRDRGIKVIMSGFGDILPVNESIYKHRIESWKASWLRDTEIINGESRLEAMRIRSRARALAQRDIVTSLNAILNQTEMSQEVLAVRVMQALESLAADSSTKDLLPGGTLDVIKTTREWLLPGNQPPPTMGGSVDGEPFV